jgi:C-terminal processing protease CtpA/Prc
MQLKYKEQKIRDLFLYNTNIFPVNVDINRHDIIITINKSDLKRKGVTEEGVIKYISKITGRKIKLDILEEE